MATRDGRLLHDRRGGLTVDRELVDDLLEVLDVAHVRLHEVAVLAGDAVALDDLGRALGELRHLAYLAWRGPDPDDHPERQTERARVDLGAVALDHAGLLEPRQALGHRRRGKPDAATQLRERQAGIFLELSKQTQIG